MSWRSRGEELRTSRNLQRAGRRHIEEGNILIIQGEGEVETGRAINPGKLKLGDFLNPFKLSEFNAEEIRKGVFYGIVAVGLFGLEVAVIPENAAICLNCTNLAAGGMLVCGFIHGVVGFNTR